MFILFSWISTQFSAITWIPALSSADLLVLEHVSLHPELALRYLEDKLKGVWYLTWRSPEAKGVTNYVPPLWDWFRSYTRTLQVSTACLVAQPCPSPCDPMDCSLPDSSVHKILQARILEWVAIPFSRGSSPARDRTQVSCISGRFLTSWATREAKGKFRRYKNACRGKHTHFFRSQMKEYGHLTLVNSFIHCILMNTSLMQGLGRASGTPSTKAEWSSVSIKRGNLGYPVVKIHPDAECSNYGFGSARLTQLSFTEIHLSQVVVSTFN